MTVFGWLPKSWAINNLKVAAWLSDNAVKVFDSSCKGVMHLTVNQTLDVNEVEVRAGRDNLDSVPLLI